MAWRKLILTTVSLLIIGLFMLHAVGALHLPMLNLLENFAYDSRLRATLPNTVDDRIVIADRPREHPCEGFRPRCAR